MPNDPSIQTPTAGANTTTASPMRVSADSGIRTLSEAIHDPDGLQKLEDMCVLDEIGSTNGVSGQQLLEVLKRALGLEFTKTEISLERVDDNITRKRNPREPDECEFDSDDDLFNDDDDGLHLISSNLKFVDTLVGETPQSVEEAAAIARKGTELRVEKITNKEVVPPLLFGKNDNGSEIIPIESSTDQLAWRRIAMHNIVPEEFFGQFKKKRTLGPDPGSSNLVNKPVYLTPVESREYEIEEFKFPLETMFVPDAQKEMQRAIKTLDKNLRRDEEIARLVVPTDESLGAQEMTAVDLYLARQHEDAKRAGLADQDEYKRMSAGELRVTLASKAILAAKTSDVAAMEEALDAEIEGGGISPDTTTDEQGNTLLILAAQQGSKRMCKLLLRRGANINRQNVITGNTVLHYCFLFSHEDLAKYLISKGADDTILNANGITCYEAALSEDVLI